MDIETTSGAVLVGVRAYVAVKASVAVEASADTGTSAADSGTSAADSGLSGADLGAPPPVKLPTALTAVHGTVQKPPKL